MSTTQRRFDSCLMFATHCLFGALLVSTSPSDIDIGCKFGRVGKNGYVVWCPSNERNTNGPALQLAASDA